MSIHALPVPDKVLDVHVKSHWKVVGVMKAGRSMAAWHMWADYKVATGSSNHGCALCERLALLSIDSLFCAHIGCFLYPCVPVSCSFLAQLCSDAAVSKTTVWRHFWHAIQFAIWRSSSQQCVQTDRFDVRWSCMSRSCSYKLLFSKNVFKCRQLGLLFCDWLFQLPCKLRCVQQHVLSLFNSPMLFFGECSLFKNTHSSQITMAIQLRLPCEPKAKLSFLVFFLHILITKLTDVITVLP